jgi:hypothetical protein
MSTVVSMGSRTAILLYMGKPYHRRLLRNSLPARPNRTNAPDPESGVLVEDEGRA